MENNNDLLKTLYFILVFLFAFSVVIFLLVCRWKIFTKAGKEGWASLIPIYNIIIYLEIVKKPTWWIFLLLIPIYNIYIAVILNIRLAKYFGKYDLFGLGLTFFNFIFEPILAFGNSTYNSEALPDERNSGKWS